MASGDQLLRSTGDHSFNASSTILVSSLSSTPEVISWVEAHDISSSAAYQRASPSDDYSKLHTEAQRFEDDAYRNSESKVCCLLPPLSFFLDRLLIDFFRKHTSESAKNVSMSSKPKARPGRRPP